MHAMIDLETMGVGAKPAILSIGVVAFDPERYESAAGGGVRGTFHFKVDLLSGILSGLDVDQSTIQWWREQSEEARAAIQKGASGSLAEALGALTVWLRGKKIEQVWANGPMSDILWLQSAYAAAGLDYPWTHRDPRCYRTLVEVAGLTREERTEPTVAHDALADAVAQATDVCKAWKRLRAGLAPSAPPADGRPYSADEAMVRLSQAHNANRYDIGCATKCWTEGNWKGFEDYLR